MGMGPRLELRQSQSLVMTPQLRQAIKLLQYTNLEAAAFVDSELERNPLLERDDRPDRIGEAPAPDQRMEALGALDAVALLRREKLPDAVEADHGNTYDGGGPGDGASYGSSYGGRTAGGRLDDDDRTLDDLPGQARTLRAHLGEQLRLGLPDHGDRVIGAHLIALLDGAGRVETSDDVLASALGVDAARVAAVRARMSRFDPVGLFAPDLRQCLMAQCAERNRLDPAMQALLDNLPLLAQRNTRALMALCGVDAGDMAEMVAELRRLDPKPASAWDHDPLPTIAPDVLMRAAPDGEWVLELNPDTMPRVLVNERYMARVAPAQRSREVRAFVGENLSSANWLVKSLQQRAATILKVSAEVVRQQDGFFRGGVGHLRPLILRDVAGEVQMHESTVSRVTANKYIATPRGTFELKYFFTTAIGATGGGDAHSAEAVRHRIRAMVGAEGPDSILSDDAIVAALRREGVDIARRTVAKYRDALRIPSSVQRKREKTVPA